MAERPVSQLGVARCRRRPTARMGQPKTPTRNRSEDSRDRFAVPLGIAGEAAVPGRCRSGLDGSPVGAGAALCGAFCFDDSSEKELHVSKCDPRVALQHGYLHEDRLATVSDDEAVCLRN